jgi:hypothetical protein
MTNRLPKATRSPSSVARMIPRPLACLALLFTATALPAQFFLSVDTEPRRTARATWLGLSGQQSVTLDYGQPAWRAEYEPLMEQSSAAPLMLGKGGLTTLRTDVDLLFGDRKVPRGRWYVSARRIALHEFALALFVADKVDASGRGATTLLATEPDLRIPMRFAHEADSVDLFEITLADSKRTATSLLLTLAWGPYRLRTEVAPSFDDRKPEGAPEFALTAEGKGTKTASGLVHEQLRAGTGASPGASDKVLAHYVGWLLDGTMFDSTHVHGGPEPLVADWVTKGFAEGLQLMQPGSTFRFTIPPHLAFGDRGAGNRVPPNATIVYVVTLVGIDGR